MEEKNLFHAGRLYADRTAAAPSAWFGGRTDFRYGGIVLHGVLRGCRFLVVSAPIALSFLVRDEIEKQSTRNDMLIFNLSMLNAEIMFVALFGTANYFARLANYFLIFQTLTLPWLLRFFRPSARRMLTVCIVVCYVLYFYYQSAIVLPFDYFFDRVDLIDYIKTLLP